MNLEANTCKVLKLTMILDRDEQEEFFVDEDDFKIDIIFTDVKEKEKILNLDTYASWTAIEDFMS
ncbi:hypothetical protein [Terribacillus sp. JSM ZJ617]|uniref:hypothetical protein n=1 Tax=Terribacillus sp. JSM ZJ617 TaxID=3342119 RepID=UPI0035A92FE8